MRFVLIVALVSGLVSCGSEEKGGSGGGAGGGGTETVKLDQSSPAALAESIFAAARSGQLGILDGIAAPEADGDSKRVADVAKAEAAQQDEFKSYFKTGKVNGEVKVEGTRAAVPILFGPDGTRPETLNMVQVDGKWLLQSF